MGGGTSFLPQNRVESPDKGPPKRVPLFLGNPLLTLHPTNVSRAHANARLAVAGRSDRFIIIIIIIIIIRNVEFQSGSSSKPHLKESES